MESLKAAGLWKHRGRGALVLAAVFLFSAGYFAGHTAGRWTIEHAMTRQFPAVFLLNKPTYRFYEAYRLVNSTDDAERLRGYYLLFENRIIDTDYFSERLDIETSDINKRTIIWILGYSGEPEKAVKAFSLLYGTSGVIIRREMLRALQRMGDDYFREFITAHNIRGEILEGL